MKIVASLLLGFVMTGHASQAGQRRLEKANLAGYQPQTQITNEAALDLDQQILEERAGVADFDHAKRIYQNGGHSGSYARITLIAPPDNKSYKAGTTVMGFTEGNSNVIASLKEDTEWGALNGGNVTINVLYTVSDEQSHHVDCMVGDLFALEAAYRVGCLKPTGEIEIIPVGTSATTEKFAYAYDTRIDNENWLTLQSLSINAETTMKSSSGSYYSDFQKFVNYYGNTNYADKWVMGAATGTDTAFTKNRGNANFSAIFHTGGKGRIEAMTNGVWLLNVWMYVIRQMEYAIDLCNVECTESTKDACEDHAVAEWDKAVAYYAGSLAGENGEGRGVFPYAHANSRAKEFKTTGYKSDDTSGAAYVNLETIYLFQRGQGILMEDVESASRCESARNIKNSIANLMKVPLIQSIYRYAWMREFQTTYDEKHEATAATFTAALLPYVHECTASHSAFLYDHTKLGVGAGNATGSFAKIKSRMEEMYSCLGVTCAQVGGYHGDGEYMEGAEPCKDGSFVIDRTPEGMRRSEGAPQDDKNPVVALGAIVAVCAMLGLAAVVYLRRKAPKELEDTRNIAAVTAIAEVDLA